VSTDPRYGVDVVNDQSKLVTLTESSVAMPAQTGTVSDLITDLTAIDLTGNISIQIGASNGGPVALASAPTTMATLAAALQTALRSLPNTAFANVTVAAVGSIGTGAFLQVKAGTDAADDVVVLSGPLATELGLSVANNTNVQQYAVGGGAVEHQNGANAGVAQPGNNGTQPGAAELVDALTTLDPVDLFNILCIPRTDQLTDAEAFTVISEATTYCERRRAVMIVDAPQADATRDEITEIEAWLDVNSTLRHPNTALYFPRPRIPDPLNGFRLRSIPSSGTIAGLYARTDGERGVWKAPAGLEAQLRGVRELELKMTDAENGVINPLGINALRTFKNVGNVCWGARTLDGADQNASEWKYVPVRRLALFLEESLYRGTQFAVFEPNDEPLWAQIRLNVGAFMQNLFRQGAFQGSTPREAFLVKCDSETTTQNDINRGIVNIIVGFAPLKPAEFVIIKMTQLAGQVQGG
jgi:phage tail sheath protein FI